MHSNMQHHAPCDIHKRGDCSLLRSSTHRISKRSQVLVPSPHGDLRVVMCSTCDGALQGFQL